MLREPAALLDARPDLGAAKDEEASLHFHLLVRRPQIDVVCLAVLEIEDLALPLVGAIRRRLEVGEQLNTDDRRLALAARLLGFRIGNPNDLAAQDVAAAIDLDANLPLPCRPDADGVGGMGSDREETDQKNQGKQSSHGAHLI